MSNRHKRRYRGVNATGRSKGKANFVMLWHYLLDSDAYLSLKPTARATYTLLRRRYNGSNNGEILCSVRDIASECRCSKDGAQAALRQLQEKGFIKCAQRGSFHFKIPHAPKWILTEEAYKGELPTKDFMRWRHPKLNPGPEIRTRGPEIRTGVLKEGPTQPSSSPEIGTDDDD